MCFFWPFVFKEVLIIFIYFMFLRKLLVNSIFICACLSILCLQVLFSFYLWSKLTILWTSLVVFGEDGAYVIFISSCIGWVLFLVYIELCLEYYDIYDHYLWFLDINYSLYYLNNFMWNFIIFWIYVSYYLFCIIVHFFLQYISLAIVTITFFIIL